MADVGGPRYASYSQLWVDRQYADTTNAMPNSSGRYQAHLRLITNDFANGAHTLTVSVANSEDKIRKVIFRNALHSVRYRDFNVRPHAVDSEGRPATQGSLEAVVAQPGLTPVWAVLVQTPAGQHRRTIYGHGARVHALWDGREDSRREAPEGHYNLKVGIGSTQAAALKNALGSEAAGHISKL